MQLLEIHDEVIDEINLIPQFNSHPLLLTYETLK